MKMKCFEMPNAAYTNRYLQAEKKIHRSVKHIYFLPTLKPTHKKIKELALPHHHPTYFYISKYIIIVKS
jgi:hypothetical protein